MGPRDIFGELKGLNPWPVEYLAIVEDHLESVFGAQGKERENRLLLELLELMVGKLEVFPPDPDFFEDPRPWFQDIHVWVTVTHRHRKVTLKAQYRLHERKCVITHLKVL